jgi:hypothetical protein|tara:strand:- start:11410 stop:11835 length:426 start_codon:yes stop_codon:yes gene_type:complete
MPEIQKALDRHDAQRQKILDTAPTVSTFHAISRLSELDIIDIYVGTYGASLQLRTDNMALGTVALLQAARRFGYGIIPYLPPRDREGYRAFYFRRTREPTMFSQFTVDLYPTDDASCVFIEQPGEWIPGSMTKNFKVICPS